MTQAAATAGPKPHYWYLATPYSKYPHGLAIAFKEACAARAQLLQAGIPTFSPIVHSHPLTEVSDLDPLDHAIWLPSEAPILAGAAGLIVVQMAGWEDSVGIRHEIETFAAAGKPVVYMPWQARFSPRAAGARPSVWDPIEVWHHAQNGGDVVVGAR